MSVFTIQRDGQAVQVSIPDGLQGRIWEAEAQVAASQAAFDEVTGPWADVAALRLLAARRQRDLLWAEVRAAWPDPEPLA